MDTNTRTYRTAELAEVRNGADREYKPQIQFTSTAGKTKHLSITWEEFERVAAVLTGADAYQVQPDVSNGGATHTAWPWTYALQAGAKTTHKISGPRGTPRIAELCGDSTNVISANARLIAAAPDLLEAARLTVELLDSDGANPNSPVVKTCRSAIARATIGE